ncbi:MAG: hypothetical protein OXG79_12470 [Chloroflexi bacterium]|nr:hypothetical protein [Chloroflexota bacterium]
MAAVATVAGLLLTLFIAIGGFVYHEGARDAGFDSFEQRLAADEARFDSVLESHEVRLRDLEQSTGERLARIETRLESIQTYMMAISDELNISVRGGSP